MAHSRSRARQSLANPPKRSTPRERISRSPNSGEFGYQLIAQVFARCAKRAPRYAPHAGYLQSLLAP